MKNTLLNICVEAEESRLYDFIAACHIIETDRVPTAGVNRLGQFFINRSFYEKEKDHMVGLILHESLHIYFDHVNRKHDNHRIANIAQDIIINDLVMQYGYTLPNGGCTYETVKVPRTLKTSDEIYEYLMQNAPPEDMQITLELSHTLPEDCEIVEVDAEELQRLVKSIFTDSEYKKQEAIKERCSFNSKSSLVQSIDRVLGRFLKPEFSRTYTRPSRFRQTGVMIPSSRAIVRKPSLSIYLDVSGSMGGSNISKALGVMEDLNNTLIAYNQSRYLFNTSTVAVDNYKKVETDGGTSFNSFHSTDSSDVALIITDCEFSFDFLEHHKKKKVIIISIGKHMPLQNCEVFKL